MKHKPYNVKVPHSYKALSKDMSLHRDLIQERENTLKLLKRFEPVLESFRTAKPSYNLLREHELMNADLADILEGYEIQ